MAVPLGPAVSAALRRSPAGQDSPDHATSNHRRCNATRQPRPRSDQPRVGTAGAQDRRHGFLQRCTVMAVRSGAARTVHGGRPLWARDPPRFTVVGGAASERRCVKIGLPTRLRNVTTAARECVRTFPGPSAVGRRFVRKRGWHENGSPPKSLRVMRPRHNGRSGATGRARGGRLRAIERARDEPDYGEWRQHHLGRGFLAMPRDRLRVDAIARVMPGPIGARHR